MDPNALIGVCRLLQRLANIRVNALMLSEKDKPQRLIDILPASLKRNPIKVDRRGFTLYETDLHVMFDMFEDGSYRKYLPNLSRIFIEYEEEPDG